MEKEKKITLSPYIEADISRGNTGNISCRKCGHVFCKVSENPKEHALMIETTFREAGLLLPESETYVMRRFVCPGCATLFAVDVAEKGSPILRDQEIML